jgi:hypothetical protein
MNNNRLEQVKRRGPLAGRRPRTVWVARRGGRRATSGDRPGDTVLDQDPVTEHYSLDRGLSRGPSPTQAVTAPNANSYTGTVAAATASHV